MELNSNFAPTRCVCDRISETQLCFSLKGVDDTSIMGLAL